MMKSSIDLVEEDGSYIVRIAENGRTREQSFINEQFAKAYVNGQLIRLRAVDSTMLQAAVTTQSSSAAQ